MVIETILESCLAEVGWRFREQGGILPEGVAYHSSWMAEDGGRCFQLIEADSFAALETWTGRWSDLVEFEIVSVLSSHEFFWSKLDENVR